MKPCFDRLSTSEHPPAQKIACHAREKKTFKVFNLAGLDSDCIAA
jgi:hypothetical protein